MIGAGIQATGTTYAGWGEFDPVADPPVVTGGARYLGPDRDYVVDPDSGDFQRMPPVKQQVLLALTTALNSSCLQDFGVMDPRKITGSFVAAATNSARAALRFLIDSGTIRLNEVRVEQLTSNRVLRTVLYTDLTTGKPDSATV